MSIRTKTELIEAVNSIIGESIDDNALQLLDDLSDTIDSMQSNDNENWHQKYIDNDNAWRKRYKDRFSGATDSADFEDEDEDDTPLTYDKLFKEGE